MTQGVSLAMLGGLAGRCPKWFAADGTSSDTKARWSAAASEHPQHKTSWLLGFWLVGLLC